MEEKKVKLESEKKRKKRKRTEQAKKLKRDRVHHGRIFHPFTKHFVLYVLIKLSSHAVAFIFFCKFRKQLRRRRTLSKKTPGKLWKMQPKKERNNWILKMSNN